MSDTTTAEPETDMDEVRRFRSALGVGIEEMTIHHNPQLEYLVNRALPARPPTDEEAAIYAGRLHDEAWRDLYDPAERTIITPPSAEVAALLEPAPEPVPAPEPEPPVLDEHTEAALGRFLGAHQELAEEPDPVMEPGPEDALEVHHNDTAVLYVPPEAIA